MGGGRDVGVSKPAFATAEREGLAGKEASTNRAAGKRVTRCYRHHPLEAGSILKAQKAATINISPSCYYMIEHCECPLKLT